MAIKKTKRNLRLKNKRRVTKKNRIHKRTNKKINKRTKKYLKKNMSKRRRRYSKKAYQRGGLFNDNHSEELRTKLKEIGFTDDNEINKMIIDMGRMSQQHSSPNDFAQLIEQMDTFHDTEEFKEWLEKIQEDFEGKVETDSEDNSDDELDDDSDDENSDDEN